MASIIRIKRSETSGNPNTLGTGELAYSALVDNGSNGGDRLYIGMGAETNGNAANHVVIGGKYFTDMLTHTKGTLTANSAITVDADSKIDVINVGNITVTGNTNTISSTNSNGNILITPNGTGDLILDGLKWPQTDGSTGQFLKTNGTGQLSWAAIPSGSFDIAGNTGSDTFTTGETLTISGTNPINTIVTNNTITISANDATTTAKGVASFDTNSFTVVSGEVVVKSGGISNTHLANSSITIGSTAVALGSSITSLVGITDLTVDNLEVNGNEISSTNLDGDISLNPNGLGNVSVNNSKITGVATPTVATDAANKGYVDNAITGLTWKQSVNLLATANVSLSGSTNTLVIDGHAALTNVEGNGYRILLTGQTTDSENGIYTYTDNGSVYSLTRSLDADPYQELIGASVFVSEGAIYQNTGWVQSNHYLTNFSGQDWAQFSGAGSYSAGNGLSLSGSTFNVNVASAGGLTITSDELLLNSNVAGNGLELLSGVISVVGTTGRITVDANSVDIASTYIGQSSITTLGTITSGTWSANTIGVAKGGTGLTSITTNGVLYGNGTSAIGVTAASTVDGSFLKADSTGAPHWDNTIDGGTY
jgi:hypothetical protein